MTNDTRTSDEIERDITDERAQMANTISDLQKKFSVESIVTDLGGLLRGQGGEFGRSISATVGRNPGAVVLVGVGLAWLFLGQNGKSAGHKGRRHGLRHRNRHASDPWPDDDPSTEAPSPNDDRFWYGDGRMLHNYRSQDPAPKRWPHIPADAEQAAGGVMDKVRHAAGSMGQAVTEVAGSLGDTASGLTERLSHGLETLSDEARSRVLTARRAAHEARLSSEAVLGRATRAATTLFDDQPLVVGALAVALGAAFGGVLPHSKIEDDSLGNSSDQLFAEAQSLFHFERQKALAVLKTAATDARGELRDIGTELTGLMPDAKAVGQVIVDRTSDAAGRVLDRATGDLTGQKRDDFQS